MRTSLLSKYHYLINITIFSKGHRADEVFDMVDGDRNLGRPTPNI